MKPLLAVLLALALAGCTQQQAQAPNYDPFRADMDAFAASIFARKDNDTIKVLGLPVLCFSAQHCAIERGNFGCVREGMFLVCDRGVYRARLAKHEV